MTSDFMASRRALAAAIPVLMVLGLAALRAHTASAPTVVSAGAVGDVRIFPDRAGRFRLAIPPVTLPEVTVPPVTVPPVTVPVTLPTTAPPVAVTVPKVRVPTIRPTTTTTQRTTTVAPAPASSSGCMANAPKSYAQMQSCWSNLVAQYPWPSTAKVWSVMYCESKGNPWAHNPSGATGLMQIMGGPYDPAQNMAAAWSMSRHGTYWRPWTCQ